MEQDMLETLKFHITVPTAYPFLLRYLSVLKAGTLVKIAANYYTERTLQEVSEILKSHADIPQIHALLTLFFLISQHDMLKFSPSLVSCAAVFLAFNNEDVNEDLPAGGTSYPAALHEYSGYALDEVSECARLIAKKVGEEPVTASRRQLVAVKKKYATDKYRNVSENYENPEMEG